MKFDSNILMGIITYVSWDLRYSVLLKWALNDISENVW